MSMHRVSKNPSKQARSIKQFNRIADKYEQEQASFSLDNSQEKVSSST